MQHVHEGREGRVGPARREAAHARAGGQRNHGRALQLADALGLAHGLVPGAARVVAEQRGSRLLVKVGFQKRRHQRVRQAGLQLVAGVFASHVELTHHGRDNGTPPGLAGAFLVVQVDDAWATPVCERGNAVPLLDARGTAAIGAVGIARMASQQVIGSRRTVVVELDAGANVIAELQAVGRAQAVSLHDHQPGAPAAARAWQPQWQRQAVAVEHRATQGLQGHAQQVERARCIAFGGFGPAAKFGLDIVAPGMGLLAAPAQQPVVGHGAQAQDRADDVVAQGLHGPAHDAVVAAQVARAGGERVQVGQQVGVGAGGWRVPAAQGQVGERGALVGG